MMDIESLVKFYSEAAPIVLVVCSFLVIALPILGRLVASANPRVGEALIRAGSDVKGALEARQLPAGSEAVSAKPMAAPKASGKGNGSAPPGIGLSVLALCLLASGPATGCTPQQRRDVASAVASIAGAICDAANSDDRNVTFVCRVVKTGADVLSNMGTGEPGVAVPVDEVSEPFEVVVPKEQAEEFARKHGGAPK